MRFSALLTGIAACAIASAPALAQANVSDRLDQLEKIIQEQAREIQELRAQLNPQPPNPQPPAPQVQSQPQPPPPVSEADLQKRVEDAVKTATTPTDKKIRFKGVTLTLGGFLAAESVWRSNNLESDIGSPGFAKIPFPGPGPGGNGNNVAIGHTGEFRLTARQSRIQGLAEGAFDPTTHFAMYGEFDFLGAPASANSNESNSYAPRIRNLYGTIDWSDLGVHFLFGQSWSLATLNGQGIAERTELAPAVIEAQYVTGFVWTRQPQLRVVKNFNDEFWLGVSVENPQTTIGGTAPTGFAGLTANSGSGFNGSSTNVALAEFNPGITLSLNHVPDLLGKIAWEPSFLGHMVHLEALGIYRDFYIRSGTSVSTVENHDVSGGGGGVAGLIKIVPGLLDFQFDTLFGEGIGRYGASQLPDVTYTSSGTFKPLQEDMEMVGLTWHATRALDVYAFGGMEHEHGNSFSGLLNGSNQNIGYGNPNFVNTGCFSFTSAASCTGNVQTVEQINAGLWDNLYDGDAGRVRLGLQYSYTWLKAFTGVGGAPHTSDNMVFTSVRYYPFQ